MLRILLLAAASILVFAQSAVAGPYAVDRAKEIATESCSTIRELSRTSQLISLDDLVKSADYRCFLEFKKEKTRQSCQQTFQKTFKTCSEKEMERKHAEWNAPAEVTKTQRGPYTSGGVAELFKVLAQGGRLVGR